ncbi:ATP-grasp domain-containing protein [Aminipila terrae]|uniref:RimK family alpha-L-glutamate ligase n=1 Tax=Aminipila terrae TaxID=2697030 RepID=A0A6P1MBN3_9FIRM|nr:RimK family alpha-L-glutamate ligase [Aminipila terrae]QHI71442.1 RimK family alpha-L-glutamate ligase [Aminipila terrae]
MSRKIGIVSMNYDHWEMGQILASIERNGYEADLIDPRKTILNLEEIYQKEARYKSILGRVERPVLQSGLIILKDLELRGEKVINNSRAIQYGQNKWYTSMLLAKMNIRHPKTICSYTNHAKDIIDQIKDFKYPIVFKPISGGRGEGVSRACCFEEAVEIITVLSNCNVPFYIQEFIHKKDEKGYFDYRVFVVGNEVIGSIRREASENNWKTNICNGGTARKMKMNCELAELAIQAAKAIDADVAGVDIIDSDEGYNVLEVNICPLFRGLYDATGINPAETIGKLLCS